MALIGVVDEYHPVLRGWIFDDSSIEPVRLEVIINNVSVGMVTCADFRPDLAIAGLPRPKSGFEFRLPPVVEEYEVNIELLVVDTQEKFAEFEATLNASSENTWTEFEYSIERFNWTIRGWLKDASDVPFNYKLVLYINGARYVEIPRDIRRPDVGDRQSMSGFDYRLTPEEFGLQEVHSELYVELESGDRRALAATILQRTFRVSADLPSPEEIFLTGNFPDAGKLVLLARFDESGDLTAGLAHRVRDFAAHGYTTVICDALSTGRDSRLKAHEEWIDEVEGLEGVIQRPNLGWDFGAWFHVFNVYDLPNVSYEALVLTNDSILPLGPSEEMFLRLRNASDQVSSLTESFQHSHHLQSFFLHFPMKDSILEALREYVEDFNFPLQRREVIERGEIGISKHLRNCSIRMAPLFNQDELATHFLEKFEKRVFDAREISKLNGDYMDVLEVSLRTTRDQLISGASLNPTHSLWRELIEIGAGFIKRDLLSKNPTNQGFDLVDLSSLGQVEISRFANDCSHFNIPLPYFALKARDSWT